ncbi:putative histone h1.3 [Aspergillus affinis]|uniref:putative histone h1.3 n=1 Tax=Aspergillus affinis TaxID=1070780 RepID=UPI0022FE481E|nr:uncharacterized protein KD926_005263 [Aspergillus affinis]KAI9042657.1 hypothetical protein KD926_005263 [Aspergillus affinis]
MSAAGVAKISAAAVAKNKPEGLLGLSVAEAKALLLGIVCEEGGRVDMEKLALKYPYKNSASASTSYRNAKRRLLGIDTNGAVDGSTTNDAASPGGASAVNSATTTPKKRSPVKRKKPAPIDSEAAAGPADEASGSPKSKRQRKTPVKKAPVVKKEELGEEDDENNEGIVKPEPNVDDKSQLANVKMEDADEHAEYGDLEMAQPQTSMSLQALDTVEDDLRSIDLDAELDALDTPKTVKGEDDLNDEIIALGTPESIKDDLEEV